MTQRPPPLPPFCLCVRLFVVALVATLASASALAERWYVLSSGSFDARRAFDLDSIAPAPGYLTAMTLRVYVHVGNSTFGCAPPSDCIATSQMTDYYVDCSRWIAAEIRRIPMDLRDKVIAVVEAPYPAWFALDAYASDLKRDRGRGVMERIPLELRHREVLLFCSLYNSGRLNAAMTAGAPQR